MRKPVKGQTTPSANSIEDKTYNNQFPESVQGRAAQVERALSIFLIGQQSTNNRLSGRRDAPPDTTPYQLITREAKLYLSFQILSGVCVVVV